MPNFKGEGVRLDRLLGERFQLSRSQARRAIDEGRVRVDDRRARLPSQPIAHDSRLELEPAAAVPAPFPQPELPLTLLYSDEQLLILDKPAGWASHPLEAGERGTLANALIARHPECVAAGDDPREGGLCHRLDRATSGAILAAREPAIYQRLRAALRAREVEKIYLALVRGKAPDAGTCLIPLTGRGRTRPWRGPADGNPRPAVTHFRRLARSGDLELLQVRIETGVRFQIRAHLAALGFPLAGDADYGGGETPTGLDRHLLHAAALGLLHPVGGQPLQVTCPLPADAAQSMAVLGIAAPSVASLFERFEGSIPSAP